MRSITSQGEPLYFREAGQGTPVLLVHAGVADSRMWQPQIDGLQHKFQLIAMDLRGFGRSPLPDRPFSHHEDVLRLLDTLTLESAWLVGASYGARVSLDFYFAYPHRVRGLILVSPVVSGFESDEEIAVFGDEEDRLLDAGDLNGATELNLHTWLQGPGRSPDQVDPAVRSLVAEMQMQAFTVPEPDGAELIKSDLVATLHLDEIQVPTMIVQGTLDLQSVIAHAEELARGIPGARMEKISGTAHLPSLEKPDRFNRLLRDFIK